MKVSLVSFLFNKDVEKNLVEVEEATKNANKNKCILVCFPECCLTGLPTENYQIDIKLATPIPGDITNKIGMLAKDYNIYIAIGILEKDNKKLYDTALLFDNNGMIILKYRRINSHWHSPKVSKNLYKEGDNFNFVNTPFGKIGFAICGDMWDDTVINLIKKSTLDYLIIPLSRSIDDYARWNKEEKFAYAKQVAKIGITSFLINAFEPKEFGGAFGGSLIVSNNGKIIAETNIGQPSTLIYEIDR